MTIRPAALAAFLLLAQTLSAASAQTTISPPAPPTSAPIDFYRNDAGHTGYTPAAIPMPLSLSWRHTAIYVKNSPASPVAANGLIYFAAGPSVYAVSTADGSTKWQFPADGKSGNFLITPAVADGFVYVGNDSGQFTKIDAATGAQVWTKTVGGAVRSSPVVYNGMVIFGCADRQCYALSTETGQTVWTAPTNGSITTSPVVAGEQIVVASSDSNLYSFNAATGHENWSEMLSGDPTAAPVIYGDGMLYVAGGSSVVALGGRNGATRWDYTLDAEVSTPPTYGAGNIYVGTQDDKFYALNGRGHVRWSTTLAEPSYGAPLLAGDTVLVPTQRGILYALDALTGHLKWQYVVQAVGTATQPKYGETDITSAPIWADGALYVLSNDGTLSAFRADAVDQAAPTLSALSPNPGSVVAGVRVPYGATVVDEGCGIDPAGVSLQVDHAPVALAKYNPSRNSVAVDLSGDTRGDANRPLADGVHQITLRAQDWRGNAVTRSWTFTVNNKLDPVVAAPIGVAGEDEPPTTPDDAGATPAATLPGSNNAVVSATPPRGPNGRDPDGGVNGGPPPPPPIDVPAPPGGGAPVSPTPPSPTPAPPTAPGAPPPP